MALRFHRLRRRTLIPPPVRHPEALQPWTADLVLWVLLAFSMGGMLYTMCSPTGG